MEDAISSNVVVRHPSCDLSSRDPTINRHDCHHNDALTNYSNRGKIIQQVHRVRRWYEKDNRLCLFSGKFIQLSIH